MKAKRFYNMKTEETKEWQIQGFMFSKNSTSEIYKEL